MKAYKGIVVKYEDEYTVYSEGKGGVIVSDKDKEKAKQKYIEAMQVYRAILILEKFKQNEQQKN